MLIALDYDDTFTRDPLGWQSVCAILKVRGHTIVGATMRNHFEAKDINPIYLEICTEIYFSNREAKRAFLAREGVFPDVWIDDNPEFICYSASA